MEHIHKTPTPPVSSVCATITIEQFRYTKPDDAIPSLHPGLSQENILRYLQMYVQMTMMLQVDWTRMTQIRNGLLTAPLGQRLVV